MGKLERKRIGIFGGTFDPIHNGHIALARAAMERENLDLVLFVVAANPVHKQPEASAQARLAMVMAALDAEPKLVCCDVEYTMPEPVYAVDTVLRLKEQFPDADFVFILGSDAAASFPYWCGSKRLEQLVQVACFPRRGDIQFEAKTIESRAGDGFTFTSHVLELPAISSSAIREKIHAGIDASEDLPDAAAEYIRKHRLYRRME